MYLLALLSLHTPGHVTVHSCAFTFYPASALVEGSSTAAVSGVSCWVSLFERQELPALLLSPAHDNNTDQGKSTRNNDWEKKILDPDFQTRTRSREGTTSRLHGVVVRFSTALVFLANQRTPGEYQRLIANSVSEFIFPAKLAVAEGKKLSVSTLGVVCISRLC